VRIRTVMGAVYNGFDSLRLQRHQHSWDPNSTSRVTNNQTLAAWRRASVRQRWAAMTVLSDQDADRSKKTLNAQEPARADALAGLRALRLASCPMFPRRRRHRCIRLFLDLRGSTFALCAGANIFGYTPLTNNGTAGLSLQRSLYDSRHSDSWPRCRRRRWSDRRRSGSPHAESSGSSSRRIVSRRGGRRLH
jgi:hypothetical protein